MRRPKAFSGERKDPPKKKLRKSANLKSDFNVYKWADAWSVSLKGAGHPSGWECAEAENWECGDVGRGRAGEDDMGRTNVTAFGAIGAAILASSCCIGPLLFAVLGLGAFGLGAALERFRPVLIALTVVLLGLGFYMTYRRRKTVCADGRCESHGASTWNKAVLWIAAALAAISLTFPEWSPLLLKAEDGARTMTLSVTLNVTGMTCGGCAVNVQRALAAVPGVTSSAVNLELATATVALGEGPPLPDVPVAAVEAAGYGASLAVPASSAETER